MAPPDVESWRVEAPTRPCAFCRQNVVGDPCTSCPRCDAKYHPDCWVSNSRRCAVYGCEPGLKPAVILTLPVRPLLRPPELPRSGVSWPWVVPILSIFVANMLRLGMEGSPIRTAVSSPPAPQILRQGVSSDRDRPEEASESVIPAPLQDVPALIREADGIVNSVSPLTSMPPGRLTDDVRKVLRWTVADEVDKLERALKIYQRCAAAQGDEMLRTRINRLRGLIVRKRSLLLVLKRATGPD